MKKKLFLKIFIPILLLLTIVLIAIFCIPKTYIFYKEQESIALKHEKEIIKELNKYNKGKHYDNIILLIGDGMGPNQLEATKYLHNIDSLYMETLPYKCESKTKSFDNLITDSAAGATALSTGFKVYNGAIGQFNDYKLELITSIAKKNNMKTGIITTDDSYGATPASFSGYSIDRGEKYDITASQLDLNIVDYFISSVCEENIIKYYMPKIIEDGYTYIDSYSNLPESKDGRYIGIIDNLYEPIDKTKSYTSLVSVVENSINYLSNSNGFFLMVEGARIDKNNHANKLNEMSEELLAFDRAVEYSVEWAKQNKNTLVIVTADHESGGLLPDSNNGYKYTSTGHTGVNVPLFVYGLEIEEKAYRNTDIFAFMKYAIMN